MLLYLPPLWLLTLRWYLAGLLRRIGNRCASGMRRRFPPLLRTFQGELSAGTKYCAYCGSGPHLEEDMDVVEDTDDAGTKTWFRVCSECVWESREARP